MNERIKKLRKALDLTQREFGERIGVKPNTIATYEIGRNEPIDAVISLICREFNVSEAWLRTGEGAMFVKRTENDELSQVFSAIASSDDELIKRIIRAYWKLDDKEKAAVKRLIDGFTLDGSGPATPVLAPASADKQVENPLTIDEKVELYRQQLLLEQEREKQASSASESDAG